MPQCCCGSWLLRRQNLPVCISKASKLSATWFILPLPHCCSRRVCACSRVLRVHTRWRCVCETCQRLRVRLARSCSSCSISTGQYLYFCASNAGKLRTCCSRYRHGFGCGRNCEWGVFADRQVPAATYTHNDVHTIAVSICRTQ
jgi:hypothetical protein